MRYTCAVCGATREAPYLYEYEPDWTASVSAKLEGSKMTCRVIASKAVDAVVIVATYDADGRVLEWFETAFGTPCRFEREAAA